MSVLKGFLSMSKQIRLTQGQFAIVDNKNYRWLIQWKWYARWSNHTQSFYAMRNGRQYSIYMAREILGLKKGDKRQADHKKHNTLDNRESNLRIVTHQRNQWNRKNPKGYVWHKGAKKYEVRIRLNRKRIYLGLFDTAEDAHAAYLKAKKKYHKI